jgi:hypothetical protein
VPCLAAVALIAEGLSHKEAQRRLNDFGPNALTPPAKPGFLKKLWHHLNNVSALQR